MKRVRFFVAAAAVGLVLGASSLLGAMPVAAEPMEKAEICHFTSSEHNEFVVIDISGNAVSKHFSLHGNPINGQGDDGYYDAATDTCVVPGGED